MSAAGDEKANYCNRLISIIRFPVLLTVFFMAGCAAGNYGHLTVSRDVARAFETFPVYPEHRYYHLNQENNPYAVVALQNSYRLLGNMWVEFDPRSDKLEKVVSLIKDFAYSYARPYGAYIHDQTGNQIGYLFSTVEVRSLKIDAPNQYVSIYTDMPWLRDDDRPAGGYGIGVGR